MSCLEDVLLTKCDPLGPGLYQETFVTFAWNQSWSGVDSATGLAIRNELSLVRCRRHRQCYGLILEALGLMPHVSIKAAQQRHVSQELAGYAVFFTSDTPETIGQLSCHDSTHQF